MNTIKMLIAFGVGLIIGVVGGGFAGYTVGNTNRAIERAPDAMVVEVQEERHPVRPTPPVDTAANAEETSETAAVATGASAAYVISPNDDSEIMWVGYKSVLGQNISMEGGFANFEGTLVVVDESPDESYVEVVVDVNALFSQNSILTTVLKGEHFFDVPNNPTARFASTKIESAESGYLVTGNFTMRNVTQGIQFPATIERRGDNVYAEAEFKIDRKLWNVGYDSYEDALILSEVVISFKILAEPAE